MLRSITAEPERRRFHGPSPLRCVSKHEGPPSSSFETRARSLDFAGALAHTRSNSRLTMSNSHSRSRGAFGRPGFCNFASPTPNRGVGGAPRNVRVLGGTPVGHAITRRVRRLRGALRPMTRGRSPLGAPPWRFWAPGAALPSPSAPAVLQRRAGALRIRAASSSHPGRSAWRAGSLPPGANGYEPSPQDATPRSAFRIVSGDALNERGCECCSMHSLCSQ